MSDFPVSNPYDFRTPVRSRRLLAGRETEIEQIDELLRGAAIGKPSHFSLFGPPGMGKSSLLNGVMEVAAERHLLPVKVELREATVESTLSLYAAVFDAALDALLRLNALTTEHPTMRAWSQQTLTGDTSLTFDAQHLELGLIIAAKLNGKVIGEVPGPVLRRDIDRLLELGEFHGIRGIVVGFDSAEFLDDNNDLAPSLMELANSNPALTLVTAEEQAGKLQSVAPRAWTQIEVGPFSGPTQILDAITRPLIDAEELELELRLRTAQEIQMLTEGHPYEVNLVCHFIWEAITHGEQSEFALSGAVIERVMHDLEERGRHEATPTIASIRNLTNDDLESIAGIAPFEGLTVTQLARLRIMPEDYDDDRLEEVENEVRDDLARFSSLGIIRIDRDRFELIGGTETRLYLRYAVEQRANRKIEYDETYAARATGVCRQRLSDVLLGPDHLNKLLMGQWSRRELGDGFSGRWLHRVVDSVGQQNVSALSELLPGFDQAESLAEFAEKGGVVFGFVLQVGLQTVEYVDVAINVEELTTEEAQARADEWITETSALFAKYEISFLEMRCEQLSPNLSKDAAAYSELLRCCAVVFYMHRSGIVDDAIHELSNCIDRCETLIGDNPTDPLIRSELADALNRLGFMRATAEEWDKAAAALERSRELSLADEWLAIFNLGYVRASNDEVAEAVELARESRAQMSPVNAKLVLHAWFPVPNGWSPGIPRANVVVISGGWAERFVELQAQVYAAKCDPNEASALRDDLDGLSLSSPAGMLRLAAWAELTILGRVDRAVELFDRAVHATDLDEMAAVVAEHEYAQRKLTAESDIDASQAGTKA